MALYSKIEKWSSTHNPRWLVFLRILLGIFLFTKGMYFLQDSLLLPQLLAGTALNYGNNLFLAQLITWVHLLGGFFIILGFFTRTSVLLQIPIVLGAIIFVNTKHGFMGNSELAFSLLVLALLVVFFIEGGGKISLDNYFKHYFKINAEH